MIPPPQCGSGRLRPTARRIACTAMDGTAMTTAAQHDAARGRKASWASTCGHFCQGGSHRMAHNGRSDLRATIYTLPSMHLIGSMPTKTKQPKPKPGLHLCLFGVLAACGPAPFTTATASTPGGFTRANPVHGVVAVPTFRKCVECTPIRLLPQPPWLHLQI
jgi:hypothetical protein